MSQRILVVEDEGALNDALCDALREKGYEVFGAFTAEEGERLAEQYKPDMILTDENLPNQSGLEMISRLRQSEWGAVVPVFVLTNNDSTFVIADAVEQKVSGYMVKANHSLEEIANRIAELMPKTTETTETQVA